MGQLLVVDKSVQFVELVRIFVMYFQFGSVRLDVRKMYTGKLVAPFEIDSLGNTLFMLDAVNTSDVVDG